MKKRLDVRLVELKLTRTRSQAESWIKLGKVTVDGRVVTKPGTFVSESVPIKLTAAERYVSRAGLKLASVAEALGLDFTDKVVLDVGSSTGGFTDYALQHRAKFVYAVDVGTDQLHPSLRGNPKIELYEKTDIRQVTLEPGRSSLDGSREDANEQFPASSVKTLASAPDIVVIDVSFISLREILPHISYLITLNSVVVAMVKPQFEASRRELGSNGVVKNDSIRRDILKSFELWVKQNWLIVAKSDSEVAGSTGNRERFYSLRKA